MAPATFTHIFGGSKLVEVVDGRYTVAVRSEMVLAWAERQFREILEGVVTAVVGEVGEVSFVVR